MTIKRTLLVLALSCWLAAPAFAQSAADPAAAPADPYAADPAAADPAGEAMPSSTAPDPVAAAEDIPVEREEELASGSARCGLKDLCIGPVLTLGLINPLGIGAHARYGDHVGFGLDYQFIPSLSFGDASAGWSLFTLEGRWYPFGGAFWVGGGFGYQSFSAEGQASDPTGATVSVEGSVGVPAFKLGLGFMGRDGFVMGIDLGFNIPLGGTDVEFEGAVPGAPGDSIALVRKDIQDASDKGIGLIPFIPQLNLLRIGYLF